MCTFQFLGLLFLFTTVSARASPAASRTPKKSNDNQDIVELSKRGLENSDREMNLDLTKRDDLRSELEGNNLFLNHRIQGDSFTSQLDKRNVGKLESNGEQNVDLFKRGVDNSVERDEGSTVEDKTLQKRGEDKASSAENLLSKRDLATENPLDKRDGTNSAENSLNKRDLATENPLHKRDGTNSAEEHSLNRRGVGSFLGGMAVGSMMNNPYGGYGGMGGMGGYGGYGGLGGYGGYGMGGYGGYGGLGGYGGMGGYGGYGGLGGYGGYGGLGGYGGYGGLGGYGGMGGYGGYGMGGLGMGGFGYGMG